MVVELTEDNTCAWDERSHDQKHADCKRRFDEIQSDCSDADRLAFILISDTCMVTLIKHLAFSEIAFSFDMTSFNMYRVVVKNENIEELVYYCDGYVEQYKVVAFTGNESAGEI